MAGGVPGESADDVVEHFIASISGDDAPLVVIAMHFTHRSIQFDRSGIEVCGQRVRELLHAAAERGEERGIFLFLVLFAAMDGGIGERRMFLLHLDHLRQNGASTQAVSIAAEYASE